MAIEIVDGTVGAAIVKTKSAKTILYESISIRTTAEPGDPAGQGRGSAGGGGGSRAGYRGAILRL